MNLCNYIKLNLADKFSDFVHSLPAFNAIRRRRLLRSLSRLGRAGGHGEVQKSTPMYMSVAA